MLLAAAGAVCLVMVVVTSVRAARRRLRYESWHLMHLYAYLGVALALPHQLWTGSDFVGNAWASAYWWSLWGAAAVALVVFRVGVPLRHSWQHRLRVEAVVAGGARGGVGHAAGAPPGPAPVAGGAVRGLRFRDGPGWTRANPYSTSAAPHPDWMRVTVRDVGDGSGRAARLRPGTRVLLEGPYGRLTLGARTDPARPVVLMGAGVGTAPLRALFEAVPEGVPAVLVQRSRTEGDVLYADELAQLVTAGGDDPTTGEPARRAVALVGPRAERATAGTADTGRSAGSWLPQAWGHLDDAAALQHLAPRVADADVYVCGPADWTAACVRAALAAGTPRGRIHIESFAW